MCVCACLRQRDYTSRSRRDMGNRKCRREKNRIARSQHTLINLDEASELAAVVAIRIATGDIYYYY